MAKEPTKPAAARAFGSVATALDEPVERAVYTLSEPFKSTLNGSETDIHGVGMRPFGREDLPLLDQYLGKPIALAQHLIAALCDMAHDEVAQLAIDDFTMLAGDALWQVEQLCIAMGLPPRFFFEPSAEGERA